MLCADVILYVTVGVGTTAATALWMWYHRPSVMLKALLRLYLYSTGLRLKYIRAGDYRFCYAERGTKSPNKPTLVLMHGFSASKDMWVPVVKLLPKDIHIIVLDLPGHGDSQIPGEFDDIKITRYALFLHNFKEAVGITEAFHLAGTSMGGLIAALYASEYRDDLCKLTLICPGMHTPIETEFQKVMRSTQNVNNCALIPTTVHETQIMLDTCSYSKNQLNKQILQGVLELRQPKNAYFKRLLAQLLELERSDEGKELSRKVWTRCTVPTQVIWGKQDEVIHVSGTEYLREKLPNCARIDLIDNCGHTCNMEKPKFVAKYLLEFILDEKKAD